MSSPQKPQLIFLPGAWHLPSCFTPLITALTALGYTCHTRQLPSVGNPSPPQDLSEDIAAVQSLVEEAIGDAGNDVVVFPHSWAGLLASCGLRGYGKKEREGQGKKGGVVRTGYIAAFIAEEGFSVYKAIGEVVPEWWDVQGPYVYAKDPALFYNDLPEDTSNHYFSQLQSQSLASFYTAYTGTPSWLQIPSCYLLCEDDLAVPQQGQEMAIERVRELGGDVEVTRVKSGHSPFLSHVEETVAWVEKVAGQKV